MPILIFAIIALAAGLWWVFGVCLALVEGLFKTLGVAQDVEPPSPQPRQPS